MSADRVHTVTYGDDGSHPKAICGYRGAGSKGRMTTCRGDLLAAHGDRACPDCLAALATDRSAP